MNHDHPDTQFRSTQENDAPGADDHPYRWSGRMVAAVIDSFMGSLELRWSGGENAIEALRNHGNLVVTFWHEWVLPLSYTLKSNGFCALTSRHHDGARLGSALRWLGVEVCHGSSTRGGLRGFQELETLARTGLSPVISVDGPKGPPCIAKEGAAALSRRLKIPMIPLGFAAEKSRRLGTWDRMILPLPGSRAVIVVGEPVMPGDRRRDDAGVTDALGASLNEATALAGTDFETLWRQGAGSSPLGESGLISARR